MTQPSIGCVPQIGNNKKGSYLCLWLVKGTSRLYCYTHNMLAWHMYNVFKAGRNPKISTSFHWVKMLSVVVKRLQWHQVTHIYSDRAIFNSQLPPHVTATYKSSVI